MIIMIIINVENLIITLFKNIRKKNLFCFLKFVLMLTHQQQESKCFSVEKSLVFIMGNGMCFGQKC